ncbi:TrmH family RNA methyltransferase [Segniliparus rotundus]|uniref:TrmH family RNA methyltransferase n=1 Tax=Segniliparus rotundus TaxID=286802 RepID=UPI001FDF0AC3|nr:RNA methyltransferase [Segniliparus rotundus]
MVEAAKLLSSPGRRKAGEFLAEGPNNVRAAITTGKALEIFASEAAAHEHSELIAAAGEAGIPVCCVDDRAARKLTDAVTPVGLVARCALLDCSLPQALGPQDDWEKPGHAPLVVVLVEPRDPGNVGTALRAAHAFGASAFLVLGDGVDPHNPKAARSSAGSLFAVPVVRERDVAAALGQLRDAGLLLFATTADADLPLDEAESLLQRPCAWLFGNEASGLPEPAAQAADRRIAVPMRPTPGFAPIESLNLAVAAGICLYETARQRSRQAPRPVGIR